MTKRKLIADTAVPAVVNGGENIELDFSFVGGGVDYFTLRHATLPLLVSMLQNAAAVAENTRFGRGTTAEALVEPWVATSFRVGQTDNEHLVVQFQTTKGTPLQVALPRHLATELAAKLASEVQTKPPTFGSH